MSKNAKPWIILLFASLVLGLIFSTWLLGSLRESSTPRSSTWPRGGALPALAMQAEFTGVPADMADEAIDAAAHPRGHGTSEEILSRRALASTSAHEVLQTVALMPRASLTALAALDAVVRACEQEDLLLPVEAALQRRDSRARHSSDAETRQVYLESLSIRRTFCGAEPSAVLADARAMLSSRAFTQDPVARAPDQRFDYAFRMTADESLLDAAATLEALDVVPDLGFKSAAALPTDMRSAVERILQAVRESEDPIMRIELLKRLTAHRSVAEAAGIFGEVREMVRDDWVNVSAEERRIAVQQWAVEVSVCRSMHACGPGSAFGLRYILHSPYAARGFEAYRRDQIPPLIWRQVDELARAMEARSQQRHLESPAGDPSLPGSIFEPRSRGSTLRRFQNSGPTSLG